MVRARTVRKRRARGNGCRTTARHLQVAQPQCTFECDMSSLVIFQHMHPRTVASLDTRRGGGGFLLFLILLLSGAWIIGPSSSFSVPAPLSSEIAYPLAEIEQILTKVQGTITYYYSLPRGAKRGSVRQGPSRCQCPVRYEKLDSPTHCLVTGCPVRRLGARSVCVCVPGCARGSCWGGVRF